MKTQQQTAQPQEPRSPLTDAPTVLINSLAGSWLRFMADAEHNPEAFAAPEMPS